MFYLSWFGCTALLVGMNVGVWRNERTWPTVLAIGLVAVWLTAAMMLPFPLWELALLLLVARVAVRHFDRPRLFLPLSLAAFAGVMAGNAVYAWMQTAELRDRYPFASIADRLPERPAGDPVPGAVPASVERLERQFDEYPARMTRYRAETMRSLHEDTLLWFTAQPNFGVARMSSGTGTPSYGERHGPPLPQPPARLTSGGFDLLAAGKPTSADAHRSMHEAGVLDFVHPEGFGYVKDRDHVAGFQPHQFSKPLETGKTLQLRSLDLIGLVVHPEPVAYVSVHLPRMDELRTNPTRPLTAFEADALKELQAGKELVARESPGGLVRLVGAVRNAKQCQACHGGRRGELLGAFAYDLVPR